MQQLCHFVQHFNGEQHEFMHRRLTTTDLVCLTFYITESMELLLKKASYTAFDKVNHDIALTKL